MAGISINTLTQALSALGAFLEEANAEPENFVLIGGSALLALGLISRTTRDADIMAGVDLRKGLVDPRPMSDALRTAALRVAREYDLEENWLNTGPADQLLAGLPEGFLERLTQRTYGHRLTIYLPGRYDLIHLKLFAAVDQDGIGRHVSDLAALAPTDPELLAAARWVLGQDEGEAYPSMVQNALKQMGYERITHQL
ncbi:MAG: hypothetical protein RLZ97_687 [Verrucomicrobiota bacterium]|jgi:hypothetical protein